VPEYNSDSGTYFTEKYRVIVILFVKSYLVLLLPGSSRDFIIGHKELKELLLLYEQEYGI
jgi:hypothetical protein